MAETLSLYEFIQKLFTDTELRDLFSQHPEQALADNGLSNVSEADVQDALVLVDDSQTADFSRNFDGGNNSIDWSGANIGSRNRSDDNDDDDDDDDRSSHDGGGHQAAVEHLSRFITNNFVDDRDTNIDGSINQQIDTGGGDFDQDIDIDAVNAVGDGAVAAGGDISGSTVTTGDGNQVGDGNVRGDGNVVGDNNQAVTGDNNTTGFGEGDVNNTDIGGDVRVGDGGGFNTGSGDVTVDNTDNSLHDSGNVHTETDIEDSFNTDTDSSTHDSHDTDTDVHIEDSGNDDSDNSQHSDTSTHDSGNLDLEIDN